MKLYFHGQQFQEFISLLDGGYFEGYINYLMLYENIKDGCDVVLDENNEYDTKSRFSLALLKKGSCIKWSKEEDWSIHENSSENMHEVFFAENKTFKDNCIHSRISDIDLIKKLCTHNEDRVNKKKKSAYGLLNSSITPFSNLIVCESFLFNNFEKANENLNLILSGICNNKKIENCVVEIFSGTNIQNNRNVNFVNHTKNRVYSEVSSILENYFNKFTLKIVFSLGKEYEHDRNIFTNYMHFSSGKGFCLVHNGSITESSTVYFNSMLFKGARHAMADLIEELDTLTSKIADGQIRGCIIDEATAYDERVDVPHLN